MSNRQRDLRKSSAAGPSRREVMQGTAAAIGSIAIGCHSEDGQRQLPDAGGQGQPAAPDASQPDAAPKSSQELLAEIDTIVCLCMENRSFDHYLGGLQLAEGRPDVAGLSGSESNPDPDGVAVGVHHLTDYALGDPPHSWGKSREQFNGGLNDGFLRAYDSPEREEVMGYYLRDDLPIAYALADHFAVCDNWFASCMGPTWPNRYYLHGATAHGVKLGAPVPWFRDIFDEMTDAGLSARNYYHDIPWASGAYQKVSGLGGIEDFFADAESGALPNFSLVDPQYFGAGANDDHPEHDVRLGQALIAAVYAALANSPQWERSLLIVTYDEHGGFYDHVPPPTMPDEREEFQQLGFRVPSLVAGPHVREGQAVSTQFDHVSVLATLSTRWELPPINDRMAATNDLSSCIDPSLLDAPRSPAVLPPAPVIMEALASRPADGVGAHLDMARAFDAADLPRHLDRRGDSGGITRSVLDWSEKLGAVRVY